MGAFFKPNPMVTSMTEGGMNAVAHRMMELDRTSSNKSSIDCVEDRIDEALPMPIGRLDVSTTGLLIFACSGKLHSHLRNHVSKSYRVSYFGHPADLTEADQCALLKKVYFPECKLHASRYVCFDSVRLKGVAKNESLNKIMYA